MTPTQNCAIYTRKSSEEGLEQGFNSLDAQREACEAFILSQKAQGWKALPSSYDDGGFSGGNTDRPGLARLMADIKSRRVHIVVVYKVDRLTRSLADFAKLVELFDEHGISFVSVTQQFNTTSSMGRLTLNVLLSFAQFEREVTGERIRDKIAASKRKGLWMGGMAPVGYRPHERTLTINEPEAERIRAIYRLYLDLGCVRRLKEELAQRGWRTPRRNTDRLNAQGGRPFSRGHLYRLLSNPIYIGQIAHKGAVFDGQHPAIVDMELWHAVQEQMAAHRQGQRSHTNAAHPSLLAGLMVDDQGHRLTPTHAKKGARRYRYYVSLQLIENSRADAPDALRWPAQELETTVLQTLQQFLLDESRLLPWLEQQPAGEVRRALRDAKALADRLATANAAEKITLLQQLVLRIQIYPEKLEIVLRRGYLLPTTTETESIMIEVLVTLKRCGRAARLIVHGRDHRPSRTPDPTLIMLLAKAKDWLARLTSGQVEGVGAIAEAEQITPSYVTRVIHLAFLAPDLVERMRRGTIPAELSADRLIRMVPLPVAWEEQRTLLGLAD